jgi:hypothetical protein
MCFNKVVYSEDRSKATVEAVCRTQSEVDYLSYNWNGEGYTKDRNTYEVDSSFTSTLTLSVQAHLSASEVSIDLEPLNFVWQGAPVN